MTTFLFTYRMRNDYVPGESDAMKEWGDYFTSIGEDLIEPGNPVFSSTEVGNCGPDTHLGGYSLVHAASLDDALALAKESPAMNNGAGVEVGEVSIIMPPRS